MASRQQLDRSDSEVLSPSAVYDLMRSHQSSGRVLLYEFQAIQGVERLGSGARLWSSSRSYLDFGAVGMLLFGHDPKRFIDAIGSQLKTHATISKTVPTEVAAVACARLAGLAPEGLEKVALYTSGTEASEAALRLVRTATGRESVGHLTGSYHGKTLGALAVSDIPWAQTWGAGGGIDHAFAMPHDSPGEARDLILERRPAAVIVEPIQGEGGIRTVTAEVLQSIRQACDEVEALLIVDEIQTGLGRTGRPWAIEESGVAPDILLSGKALGGGIVPVSAVIATPQAFAPMDLDPFLQTSTYGGYSLGCAAILAAAEAVECLDWALLNRCAALLDELLVKICRECDVVTAIPGRGLMRGVEFESPPVAGLVMRGCAERGLLLSPCLSNPQVARIYPPTTVHPEELQEMAMILEDATRESTVAGHHERY